MAMIKCKVRIPYERGFFVEKEDGNIIGKRDSLSDAIELAKDVLTKKMNKYHTKNPIFITKSVKVVSCNGRGKD